MSTSKVTLKSDTKRGKEAGIDLYGFALRTRVVKTEETIGVVNAREEKLLKLVIENIDKLEKRTVDKYRFDTNLVRKLAYDSRKRGEEFADRLRRYKEEEENLRLSRQAKNMKNSYSFLDDNFLQMQYKKSTPNRDKTNHHIARHHLPKIDKKVGNNLVLSSSNTSPAMFAHNKVESVQTGKKIKLQRLNNESGHLTAL